MTAGLDIGGYEQRPDWPKMGPSLLIAACLILAVRTAKWPPRTGSRTESDRELDVEVENAIRLAGRVLSSLVSAMARFFPVRKNRGSFRMGRINRNNPPPHLQPEMMRLVSEVGSGMGGRLSDADTRRRILIVDDERTTSETLTLIFTRHGYEARYALSAEAAIQVTAEWVPEFSLIDVILPGMDGLALAIVISAKYPSSRVLLFTGDMASAELLVSARKSDREFQILPKPIHPTVLLETAKRLLA